MSGMQQSDWERLERAYSVEMEKGGLMPAERILEILAALPETEQQRLLGGGTIRPERREQHVHTKKNEVKTGE